MEEETTAATDAPKKHNSIAPHYPQEYQSSTRYHQERYGDITYHLAFWCIDDTMQGVTVAQRQFFMRENGGELLFYLDRGREKMMLNLGADHPCSMIFSSESRAREAALGLIAYRMRVLARQQERNLDALCAIHA